MTPSIAEDIQMLVNYILEQADSVNPEQISRKEAAERVEAYLSTFKPDHL